MTMVVESARPIAKAVETLIEKYGYVITYEDPRYQNSDDLEDVTAAVRKDLARYPAGRAPRVVGPRGGRLTIVLPSKEPMSILHEIVSAADHGHFRVEQDGGVFHVVPTETRDRDGNWLPQGSVLDVPISIPMESRTAYGTIDAICQAVSTAAHVEVGVGTGVRTGGLRGPSGPPTYNLEANNEIARSVLERALTLITPPNANMKLTWFLFYGSPDDPSYALNIIMVASAAATPQQLAAPAAPRGGSVGSVGEPKK